MEIHEERRQNASDRRVADTVEEFPFRDDEGTWIVTERRRSRGRRAVRTSSITPVLSVGVLLLVGAWMLLRFGIVNTPAWLPVWILYPETLIGQLF